MRPYLLTFALALGCTNTFPEPNSQQLARAQAKNPNVRIQNLEQGRDLYLSKCGTCHGLTDPARFDQAGWKSTVERMRTEHDVKLTDAQAADIVAYLASATARD
ncbi:MAG TPA: hypothetical protein VMF89_13635 [Polyangiales bacterium]|nr:hypothetical protein [Polyangiales bacterium]